MLLNPHMRLPKFILSGLLLANAALAADGLKWQPLCSTASCLTGWDTEMMILPERRGMCRVSRDTNGNYTALSAKITTRSTSSP